MALDLKDFVFHKIKLKENEEKQRLWKLRIKKAKEGILLFAKKDINGAVHAYAAYFDALRIGKKIDPNSEILASHFDKQKDGGEMLLIAFISLDLMKIYDKLKVRMGSGSGKLSDQAQLNELRKNKKQFISFTKGMKYQPLLADQVKKFIRENKNKLVHKSEFEDTYEQIKVKIGKCFVATAVYTPEAEELVILRNFRDQFLIKSSLGRAVIKIYYAISPYIAIYFDEEMAPLSKTGKQFKKITKNFLTIFSKSLRPFFK